MHRGGGGGGGEVPPPLSGAFNYPNPADEHQKLGDLGIAEAASPISSRPPASNFEDMMQEAGGSSGNRWPRQETLALLQIRSEMDAAFREATPKAPLWEQISRKLGELGYKRSAKKCKEKFENVHKYYKRTKEGRAGRQDGKSYKFFTQLEALDHHINVTSDPSSIHPTILPPPPVSLPPQVLRTDPLSFPPQEAGGASTSFFSNVGISFSSNTSSEDEDEDIGDQDLEMESGNIDRPHDRKRKRTADDRSINSDERMMEFFEGLMSKVMEKQEAMQQKFLEAIEKREQDRMIREEAWKRQDMARISREHDLLSQERTISASRDAAIIAFLEKITGQTINLPSTVPPPPQNPVPPPPQELQPQNESRPVANRPRTAAPAVPEQQIVPLQEASSSRWPKAEVLALIQLRSAMEYKYQETGPKGPLWEEISAGMQRMGYNKNPKRCKEKWENINKYYKKVKESNKKRPEDSKTCPYFNELHALYQRKLHRNTSAILGTSSGQEQQQQQQEPPQSDVEGNNEGGSKQPEDMLEKQQQKQEGSEDLIDIDCFNTVECNSYSDHDNDEDNQEEEYYNDDGHTKDIDMAAAYKIQFQKMNNVGSSTTGGGAAAGSTTSFMAMVQ